MPHRKRGMKPGGLESLERRILLSSMHGSIESDVRRGPEAIYPGNARSDHPTSTNRTFVSSPALLPGSTFTIPGQFNPDDPPIIVYHYERETFESQTLACSSTMIVAPVPYLLNSQGLPTGGVVRVSLLQPNILARVDSRLGPKGDVVRVGNRRPGAHFLAEQVVNPHLRIANLPKTGEPAGTVTEHFITTVESANTALINAYQNLNSAVPGTINSEMTYDYLDLGDQLAALQDDIGQVMGHKAYRSHLEFGTVKGHELFLSPKALELSDRILAATAVGLDTASMALAQDTGVAMDQIPTVNLVGANSPETIRPLSGYVAATAIAFGAIVAVSSSPIAGLGILALGLGFAGIPLVVGLSLAYAANSNNVTPQQLGDPTVDVSDVNANSSWVWNALSSFTDSLNSYFHPSLDGSVLSDAVRDTDQTYSMTYSADQSIDDKFAELAKNLGLNPNFGQNPGEGSGVGTGSTVGGSSPGNSGGGTSGGTGDFPPIVGVYSGTYNDVALDWESQDQVTIVYPSGPITIAIVSADPSGSGEISGTLTMGDYEGMTISGQFTGSIDLSTTPPGETEIDLTSGNITVELLGTYDAGNITFDTLDVTIQNQDGQGDDGGSVPGSQPFIVTKL